MTESHGNELVGMTLRQALDRIGEGVNVYIGAAYGYVFIGSARLARSKTKLLEREVIQAYEKILDGEDSGISLIIRGKERGAYWTKREFDKGKGARK